MLGKRGMRRVHLVEAEAEIGGIMRWIPNLPGLGEWGRVLNWRRIQLEKLKNVEVLTGARARRRRRAGVRSRDRRLRDRVALVRRRAERGHARADPRRRRLAPARPDARADHGRGQAPARGTRVVVYDGEGYFMAAGLAELLALEGFDVELVTLNDQIAPSATRRSRARSLRQRLHDVGVCMHRGVTLEQIEPGRIAGTDEFGEPFELEVDGVVLVHPATLERRALPRAARRRRAALADAGHRGGLPHRRLRRAADHRRRDLRRPPPRARDRLREPGRCHCRTGASAWCGHAAWRSPLTPSGAREPVARRARPRTRGSRTRGARGRGRIAEGRGDDPPSAGPMSSRSRRPATRRPSQGSSASGPTARGDSPASRSGRARTRSPRDRGRGPTTTPGRLPPPGRCRRPGAPFRQRPRAPSRAGPPTIEKIAMTTPAPA